MTITIKKAAPDDVEDIAPLFDQYRIFYEQPSDLDGARCYLQERLERGESVVFLAYDEQGTPVGFAQLYPTFSSISMRPTWIFYDLFVRADHRRRGIGWQLLDAACELAIDTEAEMINLSTAVDNVNAQRLYEAFGYVRDDKFFYYDYVLERKQS